MVVVTEEALQRKAMTEEATTGIAPIEEVLTEKKIAQEEIATEKDIGK